MINMLISFVPLSCRTFVILSGKKINPLNHKGSQRPALRFTKGLSKLALRLYNKSDFEFYDDFLIYLSANI